MTTFTTRRFFLSTAAYPFAFWLGSARTQHATTISQHLSKDDIAQFRNDLLNLVNSERELSGLSALAFEDLACSVADEHAVDMANGKFLAHWGKDGRKPYHRYSDAGGFHAVQENVSAANDLE